MDGVKLEFVRTTTDQARIVKTAWEDMQSNLLTIFILGVLIGLELENQI